MAGRNSWVVPGNGILGGVTLGAGTSESDDPNADYGSPWMQAFREALEKQPRTASDGSGYTAPYRSSQPTFGGASVNSTGWPPFAPSAGLTPEQMTWSSFLPPVGLANALAPMQNLTGLASKFAPPLLQEARDDSDPATPKMGGWLSQSMPSQSPSKAAVVPVAYQDSMRARPWWGPPPSVFDPWADDFIKGMQGLINHFRSNRGAGASRGGDDEDCYDRWERELKRCRDFIGRLKDPRWLDACNKRANARHNLCVSNGGRPHPDEPDEYGLHDIPNDPAGR